MKKIIFWISIIASVILIISILIIGAKIFIGSDYDLKTEAFIAFDCLIILFACSVYRLAANRCVFCGKLLSFGGEYCPHCGRKQERKT